MSIQNFSSNYKYWRIKHYYPNSELQLNKVFVYNSAKCCYEDKISIFWGRFLPQMGEPKLTAGEYFNTLRLPTYLFFHQKLKEEISLIFHKKEWVEVSLS